MCWWVSHSITRVSACQLVSLTLKVTLLVVVLFQPTVGQLPSADPITDMCPRMCECVNTTTTTTTTQETTAPVTQTSIVMNCSGAGLTQMARHLPVLWYPEHQQQQYYIQVIDLSHNLLSSSSHLVDNCGVIPTTPSTNGSSTSSNDTLLLTAAPTLEAEIVPILALNLSHNNMSEIQPGQLGECFAKLRVLDLSNNHLISVDAETFRGLDSLVELKLSNNILQHLASEAFHNLVSLQVLDLSFNRLQDGAALSDILYGLSSLKYLYLNNNMLQVLAFPMLPKLIYLDASFNQIHAVPTTLHSLPSLDTMSLGFNAIDKLQAGSLAGLSSLLELNIDHNPLSALSQPIFLDTPSLQRLSVAFMPYLHNISHDVFEGLSRLRYLNLSHNPKLNFIHPSLLVPLDNLEILDISDSSIIQLSRSTFHAVEKLKRIILRDNPFNCSCVNAWLAEEATSNSSRFYDISALGCVSDSGGHSSFASASFECGEIDILNTSYTMSTRLGSQLMLRCQYKSNQPGMVTWTTPMGVQFHQHHIHPDASRHLLSPQDVAPNSPFQKGHYWHNSTSYHSELASLPDRIQILSDGSLYIDYMLRTDPGIYVCSVSNPHYNASAEVSIYLECNLSGYIHIIAYLVGLVCALAFFTLNVVYVVIVWIARRLVNKRRREIIGQMLTSLNMYKSSQMTKIHENYIHQLNRVRNQYHIQSSRLHKNYTAQVTRVKRGCSNQVEKVRENYTTKLTNLREYSTNQVVQIRERTNNQIVRIRDYGSQQLERLRETYKLQQQHILKLLDTMNLDNCRNIVETECMRTESMMFDIDILGDDDRVDSPLTPGESEYSTADSSPTTSMQEETAHLTQNTKMYEEDDQSVLEMEPLENGDDNIIVEMNDFGHLGDGTEVQTQEMWEYRPDSQLGNNHSYLFSVRYQDDNLQQRQEDPRVTKSCSEHEQSDTVQCKPAAVLPTLTLVSTELQESPHRQGGLAESHTDSGRESVFVTPEASPTKVWHKGHGDLYCQDIKFTAGDHDDVESISDTANDVLNSDPQHNSSETII